MGKLTINGAAQREEVYDAIELNITFTGRAKKTTDAVNIVMQQCEQLLRMVKDVGVEMNDIQITENSVDRRYNDGLINNSGVTVTATREIKIRFLFDMPFVNRIMDLIRQQDFSVDLDYSYVLTNRETLHAQLLKEAVADSQMKATAIAEVTGQRIIGIESMHYSSHLPVERRRMDYKEHTYLSECEVLRLSDELNAPITNESEYVSVVWIIE